MRTDVIAQVAHAVGLDEIVFEAPTKNAQAWFVKQFGPEVNLGNIPPDEVIPLETLRLGLRGDTLKEVHLAIAPQLPSSTSKLCLPRTCSAGRTTSSARPPPDVLVAEAASVLVHMVSELELEIPIIELDTQLFFRETYETRDRLVERYGLKLLPPPPVITVAEQHMQEGPNLWERDPTAAATFARSSRC